MKQKKLNNEIGNFDWVHGVTEAESQFLPKAIKGRKGLDEGFETIYNYDKLKKIVSKTQQNFDDDIRSSIPNEDLERINLGLTDYVKTSKPSENLNILKASIMNAFEGNILKDYFESTDIAERQMISKHYFEPIDHLNNINKDEFINPKSIIDYKNKATLYSIKALEEFDDFSEIPDPLFYRGIGNVDYHKNITTDFISTYTGAEDSLFYESKILNSYSLNSRVAEHFMMSKNNERKALIKAEKESLWQNIFSSFLVSPIFSENQYEILCLPNNDQLFITEDVNDALCAEYYVWSNNPSIRMIRKPINL